MIALVVATAESSALLFGGIVVALGLAVLVAHLASYRPPSSKRCAGALVSCAIAACLLLVTPEPAGAQPQAIRAPWVQVAYVQSSRSVTAYSSDGDGDDDDFMMQDPCRYGPTHPMWWVAGCFWP